MAASEDGPEELPRYDDVRRDPVPVEEVRVCLVADLGDCEPTTILLRAHNYRELRDTLMKVRSKVALSNIRAGRYPGTVTRYLLVKAKQCAAKKGFRRLANIQYLVYPAVQREDGSWIQPTHAIISWMLP
jgi:hypothetical protein